MTGACPAAERVEAFLEGSLGVAEEAAFSAHLEGCAACRQNLARRTDDARWQAWRQVLREEASAAAVVPGDLLEQLRQSQPIEDKAAAASPVHVPGYDVLGEIGRGGMGVVYRARQRSLGRVVALKVIRHGALAGPEERRRFRGEADALARLTIPHVVRIFDAGEVDGVPYLALEYVEGSTLAAAVGTPWQPGAAAELLRTLARAVDAVHRCGIVHRDLKPGNVLLAADGTPRITDFGLARLWQEPSATATGALVGTPAYLAPEQLAGGAAAVGPATDVYALGAILYELLTGQPPFIAETSLETLIQVRDSEPVEPGRRRAGVPVDLETVCLKCLQKDPRRRYATAAELADDLGRFLAGEPVRARRAGAGERLVKWARRRPALAALVAALVLGPLLTLGITAAELYQTAAALGEAKDSLYRERIALAQGEWQAGRVGQADALLDDTPAERRGWEWNYLKRLCHAERVAVQEHSLDTGAVGFSPDGSRFVGFTRAGAAVVWDAATGRLLAQVGEGTAVWSQAVNPGGSCVALGSEDSKVVVWDLFGEPGPRRLEGHTARVAGLAFSPDGTRLATGSFDGTVRLWDPATGTLVLPPLDHRKRVQGVGFSGDGGLVFAAGRDKKVRAWDARTGREVLTFTGHALPVSCVAGSPRGTVVASGSRVIDERYPQKPELLLWDTAAPDRVRPLVGHTGDILGLAFRADGQRLASASEDRTVRVWDLATGEETLVLRGPREFASVAFSPDGRQLLTGDAEGAIRVWDAARGQGPLVLRGFLKKGVVLQLAWSPDGRRLATAHGNGYLKLWDTDSGECLRTFRGHAEMAYETALRPDGSRRFLTPWHRWEELYGGDATPVGQPEEKMPPLEMANGVAFTPDGQRLVSVGREGTVRVWDADTGVLVGKALSGHTGVVLCVAVSPDGRWAATGGQDATVRVWDMATGAQVRLLEGHTDGVLCVAFHPDSRLLASGGTNEGTVRLWDVITGREVRAALPAHDRAVASLAFSADGRLLATGEEGTQVAVRVWDVQTGQKLAEGLGHSKTIRSLAFSPNGKRLASSSIDRTVRLWEPLTGQCVLTLDDATGSVASVAFSPDGSRLAAGGWDSLVRIWDGREWPGKEK